MSQLVYRFAFARANAHLASIFPSISKTSSPPRARSLWWMRRLASGLPLKVTAFTRQFPSDWLRTTMESVAGL